MTALRRTAWLLFAAGLVLGTIDDERVISVSRRLGGRYIMRADFHVHSFFGDGALAPWDLRREAERRGLDAIVITNHNQSATSRLGASLAAGSPGPLVLPGEEITTPRYHLAVAGASRRVSWRDDMATIIQDVHAQGGVAIAAHPIQPDVTAFDRADRLAIIDAIEGPVRNVDPDDRHLPLLTALHARAVGAHPRIALVGASDFHFLSPLGAYRTYLLAREPTAEGIIEAVRGGYAVACDPKGRVEGDAMLLAAVAADCAAVAAGAHAPGRTARAGLACSGLALVVLLLVTGPYRD